MDILQDSTFWVLISTILFLVVAWKKGRAPILKILDDRTDRIRKELDDAERLRVEAQEVLAEYQKKHRDAMKTADDIIKAASERAVQIEQDAMTKMEDDLARKENQLIERISRAETAAVQEIRNKAADIATSTITSILSEELDKKDESLIDDAIKTLPEKLSA
ncbi:MAG: F0F1 ATP synthase subunit B [Pseudomonadota bacterium]